MSPLSDLRIPQAQVIDAYPLTPTQAGMLFHALREAPGQGVDIQQIGITVLHALDPGLYVYAWYQVLERHAVLRTRLRWDSAQSEPPDSVQATGASAGPVAEFSGEPFQEVLDAVELPVTRVDWRGLEPQLLRERLLAQANAERRQGFNLGQAPLMRLFMARVGDAAWSILWTFHHVILDGRSFPLVLRETFDIHDALRRRQDVELPLPLPFRRYVVEAVPGSAAEDERFWRELLQGFVGPTPLGLELPARTAAKGPAEEPFGARQRFVPKDQTQALVQRAKAASVSMNTLLKAAWALMLHRCSGSTDIIFGMTRSTRHRLPQSPHAWVGLFITTVPARIQIDRAQTVDNWLADIAAQQLAMRPHEGAQLASIQSWCGVGPERPLFASLLVYDELSLADRMQALGPEWAHRHFEHVGQTGYPLALVAYGGERMSLRLEYDRCRFSDAAMERLLGQLQTVLAGLAADRFELVGQLPWLTPDERQALIGPTPHRFVPGLPLHRCFEQQAARTPLAPALTVLHDNGARQEWSYARLNARANRLARRLRAGGVGPNQVVGLRTQRNADVVLGILAILKAGGAYLPLDPVVPRERGAFMLEDAGARLLLVSADLKEGWGELGFDLLVMDRVEDRLEARDLLSWDANDDNLDEPVRPQDLAYVIYTSGSTGQPKGVPITHHNVVRLFSATQDAYAFDERDVWTLFHSYAFDFSVWEIWGALLYGGRLVTVSQALSRDVEALRDLLVRERVTVLNQTPTAFRRLIDVTCQGDAVPFSLRYVIFGGEALELQMLRPWFDRYGDARPQLVNMYGITETTVHVTLRPLQVQDLDEGLGSVIGEPLADLRVLVLDAHGDLAPVGVAGELVVGGDGLSRGYLNRPELTAQRFVADTFSGDPDARLYCSGDLARWLDSGELEILGRIDQQVKIRGFRIELGEIEAQLTRHPLVRQAAVVAREETPGDKRLVAYVVPAGPTGEAALAAQPDRATQLRAHLSERLPEYMVPAHVVFLEELPLTRNGKLDAASLPSPRHAVQAAAVTPVAELSATQAVLAQIWASVLRLEQVDIHEHFFALGGDSILSIQIVARCRQQGLNLSLRDLFDCPTVADLAARLDASQGPAVGSVAVVPAPVARLAEDATRTTLPRVMPQSTEALSPIQHWFFDQSFADAHHWNQAFCFELDAAITPAHLQQALSGLFARHPVLCQRFLRDEAGRWHIHPSNPDEQAPLVSVDLRGCSRDQTAALIEERATEAEAGLDLVRGPLVRAVHCRLDAAPSRLLLVIHHLVVDGVSWRILREDLEALIEAARAGTSALLPGPTASMDQWVAALHQAAASADMGEALPIWAALAETLPQALPKPSVAPAPGGAHGQIHRLRLSPDATRRLLQQVSARFSTQINAALLSTLARALRQQTGRGTWRIDLEGHGREPLDDALDVSRTVGWLTSLFPAVLALPDAPAAPVGAGLEDATAALRSVQQQLLQIPHRGLSFGVLRWLGPDAARKRLAAMPASPILFNYLGQMDAMVSGSSLFRFARESTGPWRSPGAHRSHALELLAQVRDGALEIEATHDAADVDAGWVAALMGAWDVALHQLLSAAAAETVVETSQPGMAKAQPLQRVLAVPDAPAHPLPAGPVHPSDEPDRVANVTPYPLTPMQRLFFVMDQVRPELGLEQWQYVLDGPLNPVRLRRALMRVVERHDVLRSAFWERADGQPQQQPKEVNEVPWVDEDWRGLPASEPARRLAQRLAADLRERFDLSQPPLMRARLIRLADTTWHLIWTTHHLTLDGWSWPLVMAEWSRAYAALESGWAPAEPPALPYRHFVQWLADHAQDHRDFWQPLLAGFSAPTPVVPLVQATTATSAAECVIEMPQAQCLRLAALARRWRVTSATLTHAAWAVCLAHAAGSLHVLFGTTMAGRPPELPGAETLVGPCINNVPVPVHLDLEAGLGDWLGALQAQQMTLSQHQHTPPDRIQQASAMGWRHRLFDCLMVFQNYQADPDTARMGPQVRSTSIALPESTNVPLTVSITPTTGWRVRLLAAQGSGLTEADLRLWVEDLMAAWAALDAVAAEEAQGRTARLADWLTRMPAASAGRLSPPVDHALLALPVPLRDKPAAVSQLEADLAHIWSELLGLDDVPLTTNYFDMGVHSLLLVRAHRLINERLQLQLPLLALLQHPNVRALARHIEQASAPPEQNMADAALSRVNRLREAQRRRHALATRKTEV